MKIKTAGNLLPVCAWGRGKGKEKIVLFFFLSRAPPSFSLSLYSRARRFSKINRKQRLCTG